MNTAHTIPWEAVVEGCPPTQAKRLPLLIARSAKHVDSDFLTRLSHAQAGQAVLAMKSCNADSTLVEQLFPQQGFAAVLTSDGATSAVLQALWRPRITPQTDAALRRDAYARAYVARYTILNPDTRSFMTAPATEHAEDVPHFEFINPAAWGFEAMNASMHWTARNLFSSPQPLKHPATTPTSAARPRYCDPFEEPTPDRGDPFRCKPQLQQFKQLCEELNTTRPSPAWYGLALALGRCRLFAVQLNDGEDFTLSPLAFDHAADVLIETLGEAAGWLKELFSTPDSRSIYLQRNLAMELLEIRMDAHAAYLALDEAYAAARYEDDASAGDMGRRLNQVRRVVNLFDGNLKKQLPLLRLAASTFLLENWRRLLAPTYRQLPPWWLDGCLE